LDELAEIPAPKATGEEITEVINVFLRSEPAERADIFVKRYWYLQNVKEIAAEYGYSESKITSLLFRMRKRLKQNLESEGLM
jgi:RNA polymerase sigma-70 factor (ECF subfamily)